KCDHAIVGGVNIILHDTVTEVLKNAGVLSAKGTCRVFDAGADGYVRSEAVGCILLSRNGSEARFRIRHWAVGHNGHASAQWDVPGKINAVFELRKSGPCGMPWNGTSLGDPIEIRAVSRCYGAATISSIKHLVGHAEAASGIVSLLACLEQMKHNYRTAQRCFDCPNPKADFGELIVSAIGEEVCVDRMAINNFGFSGTNCSIVVEKLPQRITSGRACTKYYLAPLSSADKGSLKRIVEEFKAYVEQSDQLISDICTRLQKGRPSYRYRHCILYDFRRHIVWETGEPTDDSEFFMPLHLPALMAFAYGPGFSNYDQNNSEGFTGFFKQLIPGLNPQKMPTHPMTPCRFHQFIANSYTDGYSINWTVYNTEAQNKDTLLPHYQFNNRKYWPFEKQFSEFSLEDIFECVFYEDSYRYVERLVPLKLGKTHFTRPQHLLITGGTGGIGKHLIEFMNAKRTTVITRNARHVPSRSEGPPRTFVESDLVALSLPEGEHYDVVVHCAGAVDNALMASMDLHRFENVCRPKSAGLRTLLKSLKERNPRQVVVASSVASILGSRGQANYAFANGLMTSIAEMSESPTMVIHWGPWKNTGMLKGNHASTVFKQLQAIGWEALEPSEALEVFNTNATNVMVFRGDFELIAKQQEHLRKFLSEIVPFNTSSHSTESLSRHLTLEPEITERSDERLLVEIIARISGIDRIADERHTPLMNLGMDSLMIEELRVAINREFGCAFKATDIYDNCTLDKLVSLVTSCAKPRLKSSVLPTNPPATPNTGKGGDIAIIGYSGAFSGCKNVDEFWDNLLAGKECISRADSPEEGFVDAAGLIDDVDKFRP
ncbi:phosphopantetheine attachment domain protein, partial [Cooperia oncophora]